MVLTFIVPVRHPDNAPDWKTLISRLRQTLRSIAAQTCDDWEAVVVANHGVELPTLPDRVVVERVDFPPNRMFDLNVAGREAAYDAVREDKGKRILAGMRTRPDSRYFMVVDDDDFVSNRLVAFVRDNAGEAGWTFNQGYIWSENRPVVYKYDDFSKLCGTSHIVRSDLFEQLREASATELDFIKRCLGSHIFIEADLREAGTPLRPLPFRGAVYRVGHRGAHSRSSGVLRSYILRRDVLRNPRRLLQRIRRLRLVSKRHRREFFGSAATV
ncbi:glycosyltransferase family A protein [Aureimonas leprariae]|uniref:Glycosyltransferase family 2 protein n=1 Tax=Plantimonas leprariae TaxID=2615207 RepID=A0A7V7PMX2_9HYPH|nr:glycosyltransferase family A protein [Aureimonas leprariae]KAB0678784.1 glycosyltransferase family 2 protein [Aureimonas leprariae]